MRTVFFSIIVCAAVFSAGPAFAECPKGAQNCPEDILKAKEFYAQGMGEEAEALVEGAKAKAGGELSLDQMTDCANKDFGPGAWLEAADKFVCKKNKAKKQAAYEESKNRNWAVSDYEPRKLAENQPAITRFNAERVKTPKLLDRQRWFGVVPGNSEDCGRGHHKGPEKGSALDRALVCPAYSKRLDDAFSLLEYGTIKYVMLTGGSIDETRPDYNEAVRGRAYLLCGCGIQPYPKRPASSCFTPSAKGDQPGDFMEYLPECEKGKFKGRPGCKELADRILLEPVATHSTTNIRNTDKFALDLGVAEGSLIITEMPGKAKCWNAKEHQGPEDLSELIFGVDPNKKGPTVMDTEGLNISDAKTQGFFFTREINSFAWALWKKQVGYRPGYFAENHAECFPTLPDPKPKPIRVIQHTFVDPDEKDPQKLSADYVKEIKRLNADKYGP